MQLVLTSSNSLKFYDLATCVIQRESLSKCSCNSVAKIAVVHTKQSIRSTCVTNLNLQNNV